MLSPSSNSAAGMVMREAMLLRRCGGGCPLAEPDQFLHRRRQGPHAGVRRQLRYRARTGALPAAPGAGTANRRLLQHRDQAPDLRDGAAHPLCIGAGAGRRRGALQIGLSLPVRARSRVQVRAVCRQRQELHELGDGRRITGAGSRAGLHQHAGHEHLAQERRCRASGAGDPTPPCPRRDPASASSRDGAPVAPVPLHGVLAVR